MKIDRFGAVLSATLCLLAGCSMVSTQSANLSAAGEREGILYMLPKALLQVRVVDTDGILTAQVLNPVVVGDDKEQLILNYRPSVLSNDTIKVEVDSKTSLLQTVNAKGEDKTSEILKKLAETAALFIQSGPATGEVLLYHGTFDPAVNAEITAINTAANLSILKRIKEQQEACGTGDSVPCKRYQALVKSTASDSPWFELSATKPAAANVFADTESTVGKTKCSVGLCYRPVLPYQVTARIGYQSSTVTVHLPNRAPAIALSLDRYAFVTSEHKVALKEGMLTSYDTTKPSEALAVASLPLDVVDAFFSSLSKIAQLKIDLSKQEEALARQRVAEIQAEEALQKELLKGLEPQSALVGGGDGAIISISTEVVSLAPKAIIDIGESDETEAPAETPPSTGSLGGN